MKIKYKKLSSNAVEPIRAHSRDAGFDLTATSIKKTENYIQYGTDIAFDIPEGYVGLIFPRSSVTKKELMLKNSVGVIDSGYQGEIMFRFYLVVPTEIKMLKSYNPETNKYENIQGIDILNKTVDFYEIGDRIGQIVFQKLPEIELELTTEFEETERGEGGFGSTDKK